MKKTLSTMLIGSMLLFPVPALATEDEDELIHSLRFDKIEEEMEQNSPLVINAGDSIYEAQDKIDDKIVELKSSIEKMENSPFAPEGYTKDMTIDEVEAKAPKEPTLGSSDSIANDKLLLKYIVDQFNYQALYNYFSQIEALKTQIASLEESDDDMWKSWLQVEQGKSQAIWGAQQVFLSYFDLTQTRDELQTNLTLLQKKLTVLQLKESLGLGTNVETRGTEMQIRELGLTLDSLNKGLETIKGQLNVMLGQDFDTELSLTEPSSISTSKIRAMDYEEDLEEALVQSYNVRLQEESDDREDAERNFTLSFHQAYQSVQDKKKALELEQYKLSYEQVKYDQAVLMNSLGLTSTLEFEGLRSAYITQVNKVKTAQQDLLQAYTAYDWMMKGLTVSSSSGTAGASAGATSAQPTSSAAPSGMGS